MKPSPRSSFFQPLPRILACGLFALAGACSGGDESKPDAAFADASAGPDVAPALPPYCTNKPPVASVTDLTGTWVARVVGAQVVTAPMVGAMHNQSVLTLLVDVTQQGTDVVVDGRYCNRQQLSEPNAAAPVVIPDIWAHTEVPIRRTGTFVPGADGYPILNFPELTEVIGAKLDAPTDPLPTASSDPRVFDQDGDGKPGVTVLVSGTSLSGSICAVQSQTTSISAIAVAPTRVEGGLTFTAKQNVLESIPAELGMLYGLGTTTTDPSFCASGFVMVKVGDTPSMDGGKTNCAWVRDNEAALFR